MKGKPISSGLIPSASGDAAAATFTVAAAAIPAGVRCGACGRLHLPHRLHRLTGPADPDGGDDGRVVLRCSRCGTVGELVTDPSDPRETAIRDAITGSGTHRDRDLGAG